MQQMRVSSDIVDVPWSVYLLVSVVRNISRRPCHYHNSRRQEQCGYACGANEDFPEIVTIRSNNL